MKEYIQKKEGYGHLLLWLIRFCDLFLINAFFLVVYYISIYYFNQPFLSYDKKILIFLLINLSYFIIAAAIPLQTSTNIIHIDRVIRSALNFIVLFCVLITTCFALFNIVENISLHLWVLAYVALVTLYVLLHIVIRLMLKSYRKRGYNHRVVVIVGSGGKRKGNI